MTPTTDEWGIDATWTDALDREHEVAEATIEKLREIIGKPPADLEDRAPIVARPGDALEVDEVDVVCEDGEVRRIDGALPGDFPLGYHWLHTAEGRRRRLIVSPGRSWLPAERAWGWAVQLYAVRSSGSWGIGDLADLRAIRQMAQAQGAGFVLINPLHAVGPIPEQEASPYLPATRRFLNPIYLRVGEVPGADAVEVADGADLNGAEWHAWPEELRRPDSPSVAEWVEQRGAAAAFHAWLQWALELQLTAATDGLTVIQDLPIGVAGGGADAWAWQEVLAEGASVGAPPDAFNAQGQDWGSPPLPPWRLRDADNEPFLQSISATMAGAGGLRIDNVMGLFRLWWVPAAGSAAEGAYVRYPSEDLRDIVALESSRAGALVVGEDLGTVEDGVREAMAEHGVLSYRLRWFEEDDPADWPAEAMAAVTTHDLPTIAGLWTGSDLAEQREYGVGTDEELERGRASLLEHLGEVPADASPAEAVLAAYRRLSTAPSTLLSATLDDALAVERRPNMPGAKERPNWCLPLPVPTEELAGHSGVQAVAQVLAEGLRPKKPKKQASKAQASKAQ